jgi:hypothetical protein
LFSDNIGNPSFITADTQKAATTSGVISLINSQEIFEKLINSHWVHVKSGINIG